MNGYTSETVYNTTILAITDAIALVPTLLDETVSDEKALRKRDQRQRAEPDAPDGTRANASVIANMMLLKELLEHVVTWS